MKLNKLYTLKNVILVAATAALAACSGSDDEGNRSGRLEGVRIPVLTFEQSLTSDAALSNLQVTLPKPYVNENWSQPGGNAQHVMQHVALASSPQKVWDLDIGDGSNGRRSLVSMPVIHDGVIYAIDADAKVSAFDERSGKKRWDKKFREKLETRKLAYGGGVTVGGGKLFITNGYGHIAALSFSGELLWQTETAIPMRGAPTYADGRVFAQTHDNQIYAVSSEDGSILWNEIAITEVAGLVGAASPAVVGNTVIAAYSSGEVIAMRVENGRVLWTDTVSRQGTLNAIASLRDVDGHPVVFDNKVYAISHSGRMVSIDLRTGVRLWEQNIGSQHTPWVAGDFIYVVTPEGQAACLTRRDGKVRWVTQLERYKDPSTRKEPVHWHGPTLAGDRLVITSSHGYAVSLSPYTGDFISGLELPDDAEMPPIVANETLYVMTTDGELIAMR